MVTQASLYRSGDETVPDAEKQHNDADVRTLSEFSLAAHMARRLRRHLRMPSTSDVIFDEGASWMDPLDVVDIDHINAYYLQYFLG